MLISIGKKIKLLLAVLIFILSFPLKSYAIGGCGASPATFLRTFTTSITTLYNFFPVSLGGATINPFGGLPNKSVCGSSPVCLCMTGVPPVPHPGLTAAFWMPSAMLETVKTPLCFPTLGVQIPGLGQFLGPGNNASHKISGSGPSQKMNQNTSDQVHYIKYPVFAMLDLTLVVSSVNLGEVFGTNLDIGYLSEVDPTWKVDMLADVENPEGILFANPVAQLACMADSAAASIGFPLAPLYWCMGSYGSVYPMAQQIGSAGTVQGSAGLAGRMLSLMSSRAQLWMTSGCLAMCQALPMPIWYKNELNYYPIYPGIYPLRIPVGETGLRWDHAINLAVPTQSDNYIWELYQHVQLCAF